MSDISDLTTLSDVKAWLSPTPPDSEDDLLSRLITAESNVIHRYLNRYLPWTEYQEVRDGTGTNTMLFANFPVTAVSAVKIGTIDIPASPNLGLTFGYLFTPVAITLRGWRFPRGRQNVAFRYNAGYSIIPSAVSQACVEMVTLRYRERSREGLVQETVVGVASETFASLSMTPSIEGTLKPFRQVIPVGQTGAFVNDPIF